MGLDPRTRALLRRYWADRLGVPPDAFETAGVTTGLASEGGVQLFSREGAFVVGASESALESLRLRADELAHVDPDDPAAVETWLRTLESVDRVIGPTFYGYTDREMFAPVESAARVLTPDDEAAYETLRGAVPDEEWEQGGSAFDHGNTVGLSVDDALVATAGYEVWDGKIAHIAVVTHPNHRNEGHGRAVVSRATERALADGLLVQYRTLDAWPWSVSLAERLGFERFATAYLGVSEQ